MPIYKWLIKTDDEKIEDIRKYFLEPKIIEIENLIKLTKNHIKQCGEKIGYLQEVCDQEEIVVTKTKIKEIKEKIKKLLMNLQKTLIMQIERELVDLLVSQLLMHKRRLLVELLKNIKES